MVLASSVTMALDCWFICIWARWPFHHCTIKQNSAEKYQSSRTGPEGKHLTECTDSWPHICIRNLYRQEWSEPDLVYLWEKQKGKRIFLSMHSWISSFNHPSFLLPFMPPDCAAAGIFIHRSLFQANLILLPKNHHDCCLPPPLCIPLARLLRNAAFSFQRLMGVERGPRILNSSRALWSLQNPTGHHREVLAWIVLTHSLSLLVCKVQCKQAWKRI